MKGGVPYMKQFIVGECLADFLDFDSGELELRRRHGDYDCDFDFEFGFHFGFVRDLMVCRVCVRFDQVRWGRQVTYAGVFRRAGRPGPRQDSGTARILPRPIKLKPSPAFQLP